MNTLLLIISIVLNLLSYGIVRNEFCKKDMKTSADRNLFNTLSSLVSMAVLAAICVFSPSPDTLSPYTAILGVLFGICTALCSVFNMKALECGPLSYTNVIISCSMVIPALSGLALYQEPVSQWQILGILLMLASFFCSVDSKNDRSKTALRWLFFCLGAFLFSGAVGVMQKIHQHSPHKDELGMFLLIAFGVSAVFSALLTLSCRKAKKEELTVLGRERLPRLALFTVVCGAGIALCNQINLYLSGAMPSIIFYPVVNGASMILTAAAGILLWKEKLSGRQWFGLAMGVASILLLRNIF